MERDRREEPGKAGKDSRGCGCEKGFSFQPIDHDPLWSLPHHHAVWRRTKSSHIIKEINEKPDFPLKRVTDSAILVSQHCQ